MFLPTVFCDSVHALNMSEDLLLVLVQADERRLPGANGLPERPEGPGVLGGRHLRQAARGVLRGAGGQLRLPPRQPPHPDLQAAGQHGVCGGHHHQV